MDNKIPLHVFGQKNGLDHAPLNNNNFLFGAICPTTGTTEAIITPCVNMDIMRKHLKLISERTATSRHAVIIVDGATWHQEYLADEFSNITIIKLPPYSPALNPIKQVWQWLRKKELAANRCFSDYEDIINEYS